MSTVYEVYQCKYKGEVVYIGQGVRGRHRHCNSGCSHVYELNKIHFLEGSECLETTIIQEFSSKVEADNAEFYAIQRERPVLNKRLNGDNDTSVKVNESKTLKKDLLNKHKELATKDLSAVSLCKYEGIVNEFCDYFGFNLIRSKMIVIFDRHYYDSMDKYYLKNLSATIRRQGIVDTRENNPYILFIQAVYTCCGIDLVEHLDNRPSSLKRNYCLDDIEIIRR